MELMSLEAARGAVIADAATGVGGAGGYHQYAMDQGYEFIEVVDWSSSAGDWSFLVSKDEYQWSVMVQTNNWPQPGFTRTIYDGDEDLYYGTAEEVLDFIYDREER